MFSVWAPILKFPPISIRMFYLIGDQSFHFFPPLHHLFYASLFLFLSRSQNRGLPGSDFTQQSALRLDSPSPHISRPQVLIFPYITKLFTFLPSPIPHQVHVLGTSFSPYSYTTASIITVVDGEGAELSVYLASASSMPY